MLTLLRHQRVDKIRHDVRDVERIILMAQQLQPVEQGFGDCIECDFDPSDARQLAYTKHMSLIIRQVSTNKWRVWRKE